jgi:hypothetical protein
VIGWAMEAALVLEVLDRALGHRLIKPDQLLIHTDQGSQPGFKGSSQHPHFRGLISDVEHAPASNEGTSSARSDAFAG